MRRGALCGPTGGHLVATLGTWRKKQTEERLSWGAAYEDVDGLVFTWENGRLLLSDYVTKQIGKEQTDLGLPCFVPAGPCTSPGPVRHPATVADHPCTFATLIAPSFGAVHGLWQKGPCRARRDKPVCPHGRPLRCTKRHSDEDRRLGEPLCVECYDYTAHVVWQWYAPELRHGFTIALQRWLAHQAGLSVAAFRRVCKISYSKVVEFQAPPTCR